MKVFKSKIGLELVIPLSIVFGTEIFVFTYEKLGWIGIAILLPIILFVVHMLLTTYYTINENSLTIKCGFLYNIAIDINTIKKISETNNLISSPAASIDRIEIIYGNHQSVIISPKQKKEFIDCIVSLNPNVQVKYKKKKNETTRQ